MTRVNPKVGAEAGLLPAALSTHPPFPTVPAALRLVPW